MKKLCALLLALLLACSTAAYASSLDKTKGTPERAAAEALTNAFFPLDEDVTLTVWCPINSTAAKYIDSYNENEAFIAIQEHTGIKLKFIHPAVGQEKEAFNLMIANDNLCDINQIEVSYYNGGIEAGVAEGYFADLTDLIPIYSPTYSMILDNVDEFWVDATTSDGKVYAYYLYKEAVSADEGDHTRVQARQDWLDEIGMDKLVTVEDYETYFDYILENHPGVVPYGLPKDGYSDRILISHGMLANYYLDADGKITHMFADPRLRDYLELIHSWYEKGYISPDFATGSGYDKLLLAGTMGAAEGTTATIGQTVINYEGIDLQPQPYMRLTEDQTLHGVYKLTPVNSKTSVTVINAKSEHIPEAMMFMDYGFTQFGSNTYGFGPYNKSWVYGENGEPVYTDYMLHNERFGDDVGYTVRLNTGVAFMRPLDQDAQVYFTSMPSLKELRKRYMDDPNYDEATVVPELSLEVEKATERAAIMNEVTTYAKEMILKFITGAEPLENFEVYTEKIHDMGIDRAIELTQEAYDIYKTKTR